jgi:hypothetical protein
VTRVSAITYCIFKLYIILITYLVDMYDPVDNRLTRCIRIILTYVVADISVGLFRSLSDALKIDQ